MAKRRRPQKKQPKRKLARSGLLSSGPWILGGNDVLDNCAAVAVANSLLLATGVRASDAELLELHDRCGPLSIAEALAAVAARGLAGIRPVSVRDVTGEAFRFTLHGLVLGVELEEPHAVTVAPGGHHITWGSAVPAAGRIDEAWEIAWACCPGDR